METLADYGTVQYFGVATFTTGIFKTWFGLGSSIAAAQLSALLMLFVLFLIILEQHSRRQSRYYDSSARYGRLEQKYLLGLSGLSALTVSAAAGAVRVCPSRAGQLLLWGIQNWRASMDAGFFSLVGNSIELAIDHRRACGNPGVGESPMPDACSPAS